MTDWPVKTLGQMLELSYGKPLDAKDRDDNGSVPVYGANGVKAYSKKFLVSGPSIIVGRKGSAGELNFCEGPFWPLDVTYYVQHDANETDLSFLHYLLSLMDLPLLAKGVKPGINRNDVYALQAVLPPLEEQKRIVALLDAATAHVTELAACYEQARTHANNLFTSALSSALEGNPDWPVKTLGEVCDLVGGGTPSKDRPDFYGGDIPWATVRDLNVEVLRSTEHSITAEALTSSSSNVIPKGSVVIATRVGLGKAVIVAQDTAINQDLRGLVVKNPKELLADYLFWWYLSTVHLVVAAGTGATVQGVKLPFVSGLVIPVPTLEEQKRIVARLDLMKAKTSEMVAAYDAKLTAAKNLRQSILEAAFGGDL
jgi:type I restriction enzyme S subunit